MSSNLKTLLHIAAEMRAVGHSWQAIAEKVQRKTSTCQNWPIRYRSQWEPLLFQVQKSRFEQIHQECESQMHGLMRSDDLKIRLKSNECWLKYSTKAFGMASVVANQPVEKPKTPNERILEGVLEDMNDWRERLDRKRAIQGLPPLTDDEFMLEWDRQGNASGTESRGTDLQSVLQDIDSRTDWQSVLQDAESRTDCKSVPRDSVPRDPVPQESFPPRALVLLVLGFLFLWATKDRSFIVSRNPDVRMVRRWATPALTPKHHHAPPNWCFGRAREDMESGVVLLRPGPR